MPKRAIEPFAYTGKDGITVISSDDVYADDHPAVKARPSLFRDLAEEPIIEAPRRSAPVEQATKSPGEKRTTAKP